MEKSDQEWKNILTPQQYHVLREKGTDRPFTGEFWNSMEPGEYRCAGCGEVLFHSSGKFESHCGWPSFYEALNPEKIVETLDESHGMRRIEVTCKNCGGHLGHVFPDGPQPSGIRYCINSTSLTFDPSSEKTPH